MKILTELLEKAIRIATKYHKGQLEENGMPYIMHPIRVMLKGNSIAEQIVGILHDVIEDTAYSIEELEADGFPSYIIEAIVCVSKRKGEDYDDFIVRISKNELATKIKLNDLLDNMDSVRMVNFSARRLEKYHKAYRFLYEHLYKEAPNHRPY